MKKGLILIPMAALALGGAIALGTTLANGHNAIEAKAETASVSSVMYVDFGGVAEDANWFSEGYGLFARGWGDEDSSYLTMTNVSGSLYSFTYPATYYGLLFVSTDNGQQPDETWSNAKAQTADIWYSSDFNAIYLNGTKADNKYSVATGLKGVAMPERSVANGTKRYWLHSNQSTAEGNFWNSSPKVGIKVENGTKAGEVYVLSYLNNGGASTGYDASALYYVDLPSDATSISLYRLNPTANAESGFYSYWTKTSQWINLSDEGWISQKTINWFGVSNNSVSVNAGGAYWNLTANSLAAILQEFPTCTATSSLVQTLWTNMLEHRANAQDNMDDLKAASLSEDFTKSDYNNKGDSYTGIGQSDSVKPTVYQKWVEMCYRAGVDYDNPTKSEAVVLSTNSSQNSDLSATIGLTVTFGLAVLAGTALFIKKKKEN